MGREHLVDLERSEQIYLVIRDRFRFGRLFTWESKKASGEAGCKKPFASAQKRRGRVTQYL